MRTKECTQLFFKTRCSESKTPIWSQAATWMMNSWTASAALKSLYLFHSRPRLLTTYWGSIKDKPKKENPLSLVIHTRWLHLQDLRRNNFWRLLTNNSARFLKFLLRYSMHLLFKTTFTWTWWTGPRAISLLWVLAPVFTSGQLRQVKLRNSTT